MRIVYVSRLDPQSNRAHVYNTMMTCAALSRIHECTVLLVTTGSGAHAGPHVLSPSTETQGAFHNVVRIGYQWNIRLYNFGGLRSKISIFIQNLQLALYVLLNRGRYDVLYFRDPLLFLPPLVATVILRKRVYFEIHAELKKPMSQAFNNMLARMSSGNITITHALEDFYRKYNDNITTIYCTAAEPEQFERIDIPKNKLREMLNIPTQLFLLGYAGVLGKTGNNDSYGIEEIIDAFSCLPIDVGLLLVGKVGQETGPLVDRASALGALERVYIFPRVPRTEVARYLAACDALVIPTAGGRIGNAPTKMFEYLGSLKPIIAAHTRPIAEILVDGRNALLVDAAKPQSWCAAIQQARTDSRLVASLIRTAREDANLYTWDTRAEKIYAFINKSSQR